MAKSRYFVVKEETMMPTPRPSSMTSSMTKGIASAHSVKATPLPVAKNHTQKIRYIAA